MFNDDAANEETKMVYDYVNRNFTAKDIEDPAMYDTIIMSISDAFDAPTMMRYIDAGFTKPV